jgi:hypothetical protein
MFILPRRDFENNQTFIPHTATVERIHAALKIGVSTAHQLKDYFLNRHSCSKISKYNRHTFMSED